MQDVSVMRQLALNIVELRVELVFLSSFGTVQIFVSGGAGRHLEGWLGWTYGDYTDAVAVFKRINGENLLA